MSIKKYNKKLIQNHNWHKQSFFTVNKKQIFCDKKLKQMIIELNKNGFITSMSCLGHKGKHFYFPMIAFSNVKYIKKYKNETVIFFK